MKMHVPSGTLDDDSLVLTLGVRDGEPVIWLTQSSSTHGLLTLSPRSIPHLERALSQLRAEDRDRQRRLFLATKPVRTPRDARTGRFTVRTAGAAS